MEPSLVRSGVRTTPSFEQSVLRLNASGHSVCGSASNPFIPHIRLPNCKYVTVGGSYSYRRQCRHTDILSLSPPYIRDFRDQRTGINRSGRDQSSVGKLKIPDKRRLQNGHPGEFNQEENLD
ncbi:hypothetical protein AVEN_59133-1 [Araneus ventricosus]|uniref:Uncharacterized protein n=1 Tax=Araneus ventricosus TaxID=182803 RepID=A0A4Y1ZQR8_ARAVE|nr:hypothetical protein AVEN_59133-1 [Araneus ventricosus]